MSNVKDFKEVDPCFRVPNMRLVQGLDLEHKGPEDPNKVGYPSLFRSGSGSRRPCRDASTIDVDTVRFPDTRQPNIKSSLDKQRSKGWGAGFRNLFGKMCHHGGINASQIVGNNPYTQPMIDAACRAGLGVKIPSRYQLMGPDLDNIVEECNKFIEGMRPRWAMYGVTIMCEVMA